MDVQVVDGSGRPVERLGPDKFEVSIAGKRRRVVSADFLRNSEVDGRPGGLRGVFTASGTPVVSPGWGRVFMMAIDEASFTLGESKGIAGAVRGFISRLQPDDFVGLYSYPLGPKIQPTTDHAALIRRLEGVTGSKRTMRSEYNLSPMEVVDITAQSAKGVPRTPETLSAGGPGRARRVRRRDGRAAARPEARMWCERTPVPRKHPGRSPGARLRLREPGDTESLRPPAAS